MIGFAIGIACLIGLGRVLRRGRLFGGGCGHGGWGHHHRGCGYGGEGEGEGGCGHGGGWGHHGGGWGHHRGGWGRRWGGGWGGPRTFLSGIFEWIDASPAQRKVIEEAIEEVLDAGAKLREGVAGSRRDVAEAFRGESFDENIMADLLTRHDDAIDELRKAAVGALAKLHATLDPDQRARLARFLSRGGPGFGSPYRTANA